MKQEQQRIAQRFIKVFSDTTLKKDTTNSKLLVSYEEYTEFLPQTLYVQLFPISDFICLADFEEDRRIDSATMKGAGVLVSNSELWREGLLAFSSGNPRENYASELSFPRERGHCNWQHWIFIMLCISDIAVDFFCRS